MRNDILRVENTRRHAVWKCACPSNSIIVDI